MGLPLFLFSPLPIIKRISNDPQPRTYLTHLLGIVFYLSNLSVPSQVLIRIALAQSIYATVQVRNLTVEYPNVGYIIFASSSM